MNRTELHACLNLPKHALTCLPLLLLCKIHDSEMQANCAQLTQTGLCAPYCSSFFIQTWEKTVPLTDMNSEQNSPKLYLSNQFRNNMFHSQIRIRNKAVLSFPFENKMFH